MLAWGAFAPSSALCSAMRQDAKSVLRARSFFLSYLVLVLIGVVLCVTLSTDSWRPALIPSMPADAAVEHYAKALRGAASVGPAGATPQFKQLARSSYLAVQLRRRRDFRRASAVYRNLMAKQSSESTTQATEVPAAVAAAHTSLNLALSEKGQQNYAAARRAFQEGVALVQRLMYRDFGAWVDGRSRLRVPRAADAGNHGLECSFQWLATLLTAWALLEVKQNKASLARLLTHRAAALDKSKAKVLDWKIINADQVPQPA